LRRPFRVRGFDPFPSFPTKTQPIRLKSGKMRPAFAAVPEQLGLISRCLFPAMRVV
jgi:hypothetical protein